MAIKPISGQDAIGLDGTKVIYTNLDYLQRVFTGAQCNTKSLAPSFIPRNSSFFLLLSTFLFILGVIVVKLQDGTVPGKSDPLAGNPDPYVKLSVIEDHGTAFPGSAAASPTDSTYMFRSEKEGAVERVICSTDTRRKVMSCF